MLDACVWHVRMSNQKKDDKIMDIFAKMSLKFGHIEQY